MIYDLYMAKLEIKTTQNIKQKQVMSYHQRFELEVLELSNQDLIKMIQSELENNPLLGQDSNLETGRIQKENSNFELLMNYVVEEETLSEHLQKQIRLLNQDINIDLAFFVADMLDSNGYLNYSGQELLKYFPQYNENDLEKTIQIIHNLDPLGCAARNVKECLLSQTSDVNTQKIIKGFLPDVALNHLSNISKQLNIPLNEVQKSIDHLKTLNPKPGSNFCNTSLYLSPDIYCYVESQEICIELMNETYGLYRIPLSLSNTEKKTKQYALWDNKLNNLLLAIKKRNRTLLKIVSYICEYQKDYFLYSSELKPCTMKRIAELAQVHESTVSRCIANKSIIFNNQIIPLKHFIVKSIADDSTSEILKVIQNIIKKEDPYHPLSDDKISNLLNDLDYQISRRTVAKYRDILTIPSSSKRRKLK